MKTKTGIAFDIKVHTNKRLRQLFTSKYYIYYTLGFSQTGRSAFGLHIDSHSSYDKTFLYFKKLLRHDKFLRGLFLYIYPGEIHLEDLIFSKMNTLYKQNEL